MCFGARRPGLTPSPHPASPADAPPITFVVVQKRHHTRLFPLPQDQQNRDRSGNVLPGEQHLRSLAFGVCTTCGVGQLQPACLVSRALTPSCCRPPAPGTVVDTAICHPFEFDVSTQAAWSHACCPCTPAHALPVTKSISAGEPLVQGFSALPNAPQPEPWCSPPLCSST